MHHDALPDGRWQIEAVRAMAGFPPAVAVSRDAGAVLAEWNHQIRWLSAFALFAAMAIGVMVYLIARQFKISLAAKEIIFPEQFEMGNREPGFLEAELDLERFDRRPKQDKRIAGSGEPAGELLFLHGDAALDGDFPREISGRSDQNVDKSRRPCL